MISASLRFTYIEDAIVNHYFTTDTDATIRGSIAGMQNAWQDYSYAIQRHAIDNLEPLPRSTLITSMEIQDWPGLIATLGLLLWCPLTNPRLQRDVFVAPTEGKALILHGRPLVEIFSVRILNIDNENPGDLYGKIKATDGLWSSYIFKRDRSHYQSIRPGHDITLTGPSRAISAAGEFVIEFDLTDYDGDPSPDDEISRGKIVWNPYDFTNVFDAIKTEIIAGKHGSAALNYVVMKNAAEAEVTVILINGDNEDPADVCGTVEAYNTSYENEIKLFDLPSPSYEQVHRDRPIPLLRHAVAVPMDATLKIRAHLWDYDSLSSNDEIANGTAEFRPEILRSAYQRIKGRYGEVEVRVSWL